ncbi:MAG: alpha/beta hydrolase [Polyangiaceae bacterium]
MTPPLSILLPGLDGTGELFERFVAAAAAGFPVQSVPLPSDRPRGYRELADWVRSQLPDEPVVLIAESFSGPIAVLLAEQCPRVVGVVLCASFVLPPLPRVLASLPKFIWSRPPPTALVRALLTGGDRVLAEAVQRAMSRIPAEVLAARITAALRVDVTTQLKELSQAMLCLRATHDRVVPSACAEVIRSLKPSAELVEIHAPHLLLQSCPSEAWTHIAPFLERTRYIESLVQPPNCN